MGKMSKADIKRHQNATSLLAMEGSLDYDQRIQVLETWHEGANHMNASASAHFTPYQMACHLALEVDSRRVLDLCAGIGSLSVGVLDYSQEDVELVLVELNPDYAAVAQKLLPKAEVIVGSVYDKVLMAELATRGFSTVISNPPFGNNAKDGNSGPRYKGPMDYEVIDIASDMAPLGVFILPQQKLPWAYSGKNGMRWVENEKYNKFKEATHIELGTNIGIDTTVCGKFKDVNVIVEITVVDFLETKRLRMESNKSANDQFDIFDCQNVS